MFCANLIEVNDETKVAKFAHSVERDEYVVGLDIHVDEATTVQMLHCQQQIHQKLPYDLLGYVVMLLGVHA